MKTKLSYLVKIWEMDSWSGRELLERKFFKTEQAAIKFVDKYNSRNTLSSAPEYYTYAQSPEKVYHP